MAPAAAAAPSRVTPLEHTLIGAGAGMMEVVVMQPMMAFKNALQEGRPLPRTPLAIYRGLVVRRCRRAGGWVRRAHAGCVKLVARRPDIPLFAAAARAGARMRPLPAPVTPPPLRAQPPRPCAHTRATPAPDQLLQHGADHRQPVWHEPAAGECHRQVSGGALRVRMRPHGRPRAPHTRPHAAARMWVHRRGMGSAWQPRPAARRLRSQQCMHSWTACELPSG